MNEAQKHAVREKIARLEEQFQQALTEQPKACIWHVGLRELIRQLQDGL